MEDKKTYTIHQSKKSLVDRGHDAPDKLRTLLENTEYRLDTVAEINDVRFVNDSRAIDLLSTRDTLKCLMKPLIWIAAAPAHERDYALIMKHVRYKVKRIVVYGGSADYMKRHLGPLVERFNETADLASAVEQAYKWAVKNDTVVFSPGCLPNDDYRNFVDRGDAFKNMVNALKKR